MFVFARFFVASRSKWKRGKGAAWKNGRSVKEANPEPRSFSICENRELRRVPILLHVATFAGGTERLFPLRDAPKSL